MSILGIPALTFSLILQAHTRHRASFVFLSKNDRIIERPAFIFSMRSRVIIQHPASFYLPELAHPESF